MILALAFERRAELAAGRRIRRATFERRSALPVSAACLVANGVRETLCALLGAPVRVRLLEPVIPDTRAWEAVAREALLFRVRGPVTDAAFVLRPADAVALAAAAFGEEPAGARELSPVEREVVLRALRAAAGSLAAICGRELSPLEPILDIGCYLTYFELLVDLPAPMRLGIALGAEPAACRAGGSLRIDDLLDVEIDVAVRFAAAQLDGAAFLALRPGANVPMNTRVGEPGLLAAGGTILARGECGALNGRCAMVVSALR